MKVLVTGGAGFIGSHCIDVLLKRGDTVVCVDNFNNFYDPKVKKANVSAHKKNKKFILVNADIGDFSAVEKIIKKEKPDRVLHLAARAGVQPSLKNPLEYVRSNVVGTSNLLEACRKHGILHFVLASSSSVYGGNKKVPFSEEDRVDNPYSPYAATKKSCEVLAANYHHVAGMHVAALRFFTVYGPRNRPDMAIYTFAQKITSGKEITLYGKGDEIKRDWTFVGDIVDGTIKALDNVEKFGFEIINLGNSKPVSVMYFVSLLEKALGKKAITKRAPLPMGDVPITYADTSKAKKLLGWEPATSIENGVKQFARWFKGL
jgi:UDP-glucuronate 4-epimerase